MSEPRPRPPLAEPCYPLDPPLVDVRIPVKPPHAAATGYSFDVLKSHFPRAEVGYDLHMLFSEPGGGPGNDPGNPKQSRLAPDVLVALKVPRDPTRPDYDADLLGPPDFVLEVLSESTWKHDVTRKLDVYQGIGVRECLLFDANREDKSGLGKDEDLWGFALTPERRAPLDEVVLPNGERGVCSAVLGLVAYVAERMQPTAPGETWALTMRWHDPATGKDLLDYEQLHASIAQARAGTERAKAQAAQAKAQAAQDKADMAQAEADIAHAKAQAQRVRANAAQEEVRKNRSRMEAAQRRIAEREEQLGLHEQP